MSGAWGRGRGGAPAQGGERRNFPNQPQQGTGPQNRGQYAGQQGQRGPQQGQRGGHPPPRGGQSGQRGGYHSAVQRVDQVSQAMGNVRLDEGRVVRLITNLYAIACKLDRPIYNHPVEISSKTPTESVTKGQSSDDDKRPKRLPKDLKRDVIDGLVIQWIKQNNLQKKQGLHYIPDNDGSYLYALFNMLENTKEKNIVMEVVLMRKKIVDSVSKQVPEEFVVKIHQPKIIDLRELFPKGGTFSKQPSNESMKLLGQIMRSHFIRDPLYMMTTQSAFPWERESQFPIGGGVLANQGMWVQPKLTQKGVMLNIAPTHIAVHEVINLVDLLKKKFPRADFSRRLDSQVIETLNKELRNKQVEVMHKNYGTKDSPHYRKRRVTSLGESSLTKFTLIDKDKKTQQEITIADYFFKTYKVKIKFPELPCVIDKGSKFPLELCRLIEKQTVRRKLTGQETAEFIKITATPPQETFRRINVAVEKVKGDCEHLNKFGVELDSKPIEVEGRELQVLPLKGLLPDGKQTIMVPSSGQYSPRDNFKFLKTVPLKKWALILVKQYQENPPDPAKFERAYCDFGRNRGIAIEPNPLKETVDLDRDRKKAMMALKNKFIDLNKKSIEQAIVILPANCPDWVYRYLQYLEATTGTGRPAGQKWTRLSCIKFENFTRKILGGEPHHVKMFISNLWLKYNTKLGGVNYALTSDGSYDFLKDGYIFISVDVCHPAPGDLLDQSVAAAVGMWDITNEKMSTCTSITVQKKHGDSQSTIEEVLKIDSMFQEIILAFKEKKGILPSKIVLIRDGVSEGQFVMVIDKELKLINKTISSIYGGSSKPLVSCFIVQKRHKVKFFRKEPIRIRDRADHNIQPGTVVDKDIVHPKFPSFFLAPHQCIKGTSKAPFIIELLNQIKIPPRHVQVMMLSLSYLSPRCTKGTSIPTPVNLADRAAERGKNLVVSWNDENPIKKGSNPDDRIEQLNKFLANIGDACYRKTLFYI